MKNEKAKQIIDSALENLANQLEQGMSEAFRAYLRTMARFHRYSFGNLLLIMVQKPDATHVAGFHTWRKLGRFVRKGEQGILILAPVIHKRQIDDRDEGERTTARHQVLRGFRAAHVFDISQTEGNELPQGTAVKGTPGQFLDRLKNLVESHEIALVYDNLMPGTYGASIGGTILLRPNLTSAEEFATLVHEFAHEQLHHGERRTESTKTVRETEAEAVAYVVCHAIGLDTNSASSDYIRLYRGTKETLAESLHAIQKTALQILDTVLT